MGKELLSCNSPVHLAPKDSSFPPSIVTLVRSEHDQEGDDGGHSPSGILIQLQPDSPNPRVIHHGHSDAPADDEHHLAHWVRRGRPKVGEEVVAFLQPGVLLAKTFSR